MILLFLSKPLSTKIVNITSDVLIIVLNVILQSKVIGCQPKNSKVMYESVKAGHIKHEPSYDTLSDGTAGDIEDESVGKL